MCLHFYFFFSFLLCFVNPIGAIPVSPAGFCFLSNCDVDEDHESVLPSPAWGAIWQDSGWPIALLVAWHRVPSMASHICVCVCMCGQYSFNMVHVHEHTHLHPPPQLAICSAPEKTAVFSLAQTLLLMLRFSAPLLCCVIIISGRERQKEIEKAK